LVPGEKNKKQAGEPQTPTTKNPREGKEGRGQNVEAAACDPQTERNWGMIPKGLKGMGKKSSYPRGEGRKFTTLLWTMGRLNKKASLTYKGKKKKRNS